jgi:hypothetical protein
MVYRRLQASLPNPLRKLPLPNGISSPNSAHKSVPFLYKFLVLTDISMDFIVGLPLTPKKHDSIWVIVDRLTKTAHLIPVHTTYSAERYAEIYVDLIVCLHGIPETILSDRGTQFVAHFWAKFMNLWVSS